LLTNGDTRQAFCRETYFASDMQDPVGRMDQAFHAVLAVAPIRAKISQAIKEKKLPKANIMKNADKAVELGIIDAGELEKLQVAAKYTNEVIQVDEFGAYDLGPKNAHPEWYTV